MRWLRIPLAVLVLAVAFVLLAPAALLDAPLAARTAERLRVVDSRGVWWRGEGIVATADGTARIPLAWQIDLGALARGGLVVRLRDPDTEVALCTLALRRGGVDIRDLHLRAPAALASAIDPRLAAVALGGTVSVDAPAYALRGTQREGELDATWERARVVAGGTIVALGTVTLDSASVDGGSAATIRNAGGDVAIAGTLSDRSGALDAVLTINPSPAAPPSVRAMLPLLGAPDGAGGVRVAWQSRG